MKCDRCGTELEIGMFPFCKGTAESHGKPSGMRSGNGVFPFTTTHVDGRPMTIGSLNELRKVERDYGVVFSAFSHGSSNNVDPVDRNLPQYRGDDPGVRSKYRR